MSDSETLPALQLARFLPYRLSVLSNTISKQIAALYQAEFGLSLWQWRVMAVLGETPGLSASDIAERTAMDKVAVSRAVAGMVEIGRVERQAVQEDGRRSLLSLTDEGKAVYDKIVPMAVEQGARAVANLTECDTAELDRLLELIAGQVAPDAPLW